MPTVPSTWDQRPILMLVAGSPEDDPRIAWVRDLAAPFGRVEIKGAVRLPTFASRDYDGKVETDRFNADELAGRLASQLNRSLVGFYGRPEVRRYFEPASPVGPSSNQSHTFATRMSLTFGAVERLLADWSNHYVLIDALYREARASLRRPKLIICHDLYSLVAAARLKPHFRCPVLYDSHEFWPYADLLAPPWEARLISILEKHLLRSVDAIITVSPPLARALETHYGIEKVICTPNAEPWNASAAVLPTTVNNPVRFLLQGIAAPGRGFEELLEGWRLVDPRQARLFVRCPQSRYLDHLRTAYGDLVDAEGIEFLPSVPESELVQAARFADVGVIPYTGPNVNHLYCCPNKLSQYMQAGLAVFSNELAYVSEVVSRAECGVTYNASSPATVSAAVGSLVAHRDELLRKKRNGYRAAQAWFNWAVQSQPYEQAIGSLLALGT